MFPDNQKSGLGMQVWWNGSPVGKRPTQKVLTLSGTEAWLYAATSCAQDMLIVWRIMIAMDLEVKLTMILIRVLMTYPRNRVQPVN